MNTTPKIAIIGFGFVGKAVNYGFTTDPSGTINRRPEIFDPKYDKPFPKQMQSDIDATFICVPTPMGDHGSINSSIVEECVDLARKYTRGVIILKSTVTPDVIRRITDDYDARFVYNPEFLTERNALLDFIRPKFHIFGGSKIATQYVSQLYSRHSICAGAPEYFVTAVEASLIKYGINSYLASKVLRFNQFYDIVTREGVDYETIRNVVACDPRIGESHTYVPGSDGKRGFSGACFPKDTAAFLNFASDFSVLREVIKCNQEYRSEYDLDSREKEQNIRFDLKL